MKISFVITIFAYHNTRWLPFYCFDNQTANPQVINLVSLSVELFIQYLHIIKSTFLDASDVIILRQCTINAIAPLIWIYRRRVFAICLSVTGS